MAHRLHETMGYMLFYAVIERVQKSARLSSTLISSALHGLSTETL